MSKYKTGKANIIFSDYPDLDVIRVNDTYYMVSTTMHFFPGCVILRSYNLLDWEICSYVYDELDGTDGQKLLDGQGVYGKGMWAASLRYHNGKFYVCFVANDTHKTYLYTADSINGPWKKSEIKGFYHDMSLLFDDDGRIFIVSGNTDIRLIELDKDLSGPKENGIDKVIVQDNRDLCILGYEGSHFYKINGKYYIFFIHWPKGKKRTEACFVSDKVDGPYVGKDVLCADIGNWNSGVAQGGIVQSEDGKWFGILFQDHGALGRIPVLVPVHFENDFPVFETDENGFVSESITVCDNKPDYNYMPLSGSDFLDDDGKLEKYWQWNHQPDLSLVAFDKNKKSFTVESGLISKNPLLCKNMLTQRCFNHKCEVSIKIDFTNIKDGDFAGLIAMEGDYGFAAVTSENGKFYVVMANRKSEVEKWKIGSVDKEEPEIIEKIELDNKSVELKVCFDFNQDKQTADFYYRNNSSKEFVAIGKTKQLCYTLDQFVGCRPGLFMYSTKSTGGKVEFLNYNYTSF